MAAICPDLRRQTRQVSLLLQPLLIMADFRGEISNIFITSDCIYVFALTDTNSDQSNRITGPETLK